MYRKIHKNTISENRGTSHFLMEGAPSNISITFNGGPIGSEEFIYPIIAPLGRYCYNR